jgi:imidazolonepropionase-like amidohydrolase
MIGRVLRSGLLFAALVIGSAAPAAPLAHTKLILAGRVLDVRTGRYISNGAVLVSGDRIAAVGTAEELRPGAILAQVVDLGSRTLLPGLIDAHTHVMARIPDGDDGYIVNLATKSQAFRALEGAADARAILRSGFTAIRDVESEGAGCGDAALRDAVAQGLVEGPRMKVATRGIAQVGQYMPFGVASDLEGFRTGAQMVSGVEEVRRAAREQIACGADLIKIYVDWRHPTFTVEEIRAAVDEAHKAGIKIAAHATLQQGILNAVTAGVDSVEHGSRADAATLKVMKSKGIFWVPTLAAQDRGIEAGLGDPGRRERMLALREAMRSTVANARQLGVKVALGFDAAEAAYQGHSADELKAMVKYGFTPLESIRAATVGGAELYGDKIGSIEPGNYADLIAVDGDPLTDVGTLSNVSFVMKGGEVVKSEQ